MPRIVIGSSVDIEYLDIKILDMKHSAMAPLVLRTVAAPVAWGSTYLTVTELLPEGRPLHVAALRVVPGAIVLVGVGWWRNRWRPRGAAEWRRTALLAACNFAIFFPLLVVAAYRLPGGVAAAMGGLQPLLVALLGSVVDRTPPRRRDVAVGVAAVAGVAMIAVRPDASFDLVGILSAVAATVSFAVGVVVTKRTPPPSDRVGATGWQLLLGATVLVPISIGVDGVPPMVDAGGLLGVAHLGLVATGAAFVLWFRGIERLPSAVPPLLGLAAPLTGAVLGWLVLGQSLTAVQIAGFGTTFAAIAYGTAVSAQGGDRVGDGEDAPRVLDVEVLDHPAVHRDHAAALCLGVVERGDHAA